MDESVIRKISNAVEVYKICESKTNSKPMSEEFNKAMQVHTVMMSYTAYEQAIKDIYVKLYTDMNKFHYTAPIISSHKVSGTVKDSEKNYFNPNCSIEVLQEDFCIIKEINESLKSDLVSCIGSIRAIRNQYAHTGIFRNDDNVFRFNVYSLFIYLFLDAMYIDEEREEGYKAIQDISNLIKRLESFKRTMKQMTAATNLSINFEKGKVGGYDVMELIKDVNRINNTSSSFIQKFYRTPLNQIDYSTIVESPDKCKGLEEWASSLLYSLKEAPKGALDDLIKGKKFERVLDHFGCVEDRFKTV